MINPLVPQGRLRRHEFLLALIVVNVLGIGLVTVAPDGPLLMVAFAVCLWPTTMIMIQRAHDFGVGAGLAILTMGVLLALLVLKAIPPTTVREEFGGALLFGGFILNAVGLVLVLVLLLSKGNPGTNQYGPDPRASDESTA